MFDIKLIRENVEEVIRRLNTRGGDFSYLRDVKAKDEEKRELLADYHESDIADILDELEEDVVLDEDDAETEEVEDSIRNFPRGPPFICLNVIKIF